MKQSFKFCSILICLSFCLFFINIRGVDACQCTYNTDESNGKKHEIVFEFTASRADIVSGKWITADSVFEDDGNKGHFRGNPFDVDSGAIERGGCTDDACALAKMCVYEKSTFNAKFYVTTDTSRNGCIELKTGASSVIAETDRSPIDLQKIKDWAKDPDSIRSYSNAGCDIIDKSIIQVLHYIFLIIQVAGIILLIVLTVLEFVKLVTLSEETGLIKAFKHTLIRVVCAILLLILPMLIIWILNIVNANNYITDSSGNYKIGDDGNPLCRN